MLNRLLICILLAGVTHGTAGFRIKRGVEPVAGDEDPNGFSQVTTEANVVSDGKCKCNGKRSSEKIPESHFIDDFNRKRVDRDTKIHDESTKNDGGGGGEGRVEKSVTVSEISIPLKEDTSNKDVRSEKKSCNKETKEGSPPQQQRAATKHHDDLGDIVEFKHFHAGASDDAATARKSSETKMDMKKAFKPDLDIFLYSNMPQLYKIPPFYEIFNGKEELSPYEHLYPYKWLQHRSPIQSAFEIANMMVKVGLDELDSDDYNEQLSFLEPPGKMGHRSLEKIANFCPVHTLQKPMDGNGLGQKVVQLCSCHLMKKSPDDEHERLVLEKLQQPDKKDSSEASQPMNH